MDRLFVEGPGERRRSGGRAVDPHQPPLGRIGQGAGADLDIA
jgi:hypothetical protein